MMEELTLMLFVVAVALAGFAAAVESVFFRLGSAVVDAGELVVCSLAEASSCLLGSGTAAPAAGAVVGANGSKLSISSDDGLEDADVTGAAGDGVICVTDVS